MLSQWQQRLFKACCYLGVTLLYMPNDLNWYWGNLVVYVDSYMYAHHPDSANQAPWLISLFICSWGVALMIGAWLNKRLNQFTIAVLGVIVYDGGIFLSYLAVQQCMYLLDFTMGVVCGLGYGLIQSMVYLWVQDMVSTNIALAYGLVTNCLNIGAMFLNEIITLYINPENKEAEAKVLMSKVFADKSVVDRVPAMFLVLGACVFVFHLSGLILVRIGYYTVLKKDSDAFIDDEESECSGNVREEQAIYEKPPISSEHHDDINYGYKSIKNDMGPFEKCEMSSQDNISQSYGESLYRREDEFSNKDTIKDKHSTTCLDSYADSSSLSTNELQNYTLRQALKTKEFYVLCFSLLAADLCYICTLNFYKKFGQLWIHSDYFLMEIGTLSSLVVLIMRLLWGAFMDRYGLKCSAVVLISSIAVFFLTYFITVFISDWMFAVWTLSLCTLCTALYLLFPVASLKLFGPTNFADIYGALMATTIVTNLVAPELLETVLFNLGWFGLFTGIGILNFVVLITVMWGLPSD